MPNITADRAQILITQALVEQGVKQESALSVAKALVAAEIDGQVGHGLSRIAAYSAQVTSGKINAQAQPSLSYPAPGILTIDAQGGFAFPAIDRAITELGELTRRQGVALVAIKNSHHAGQLGAHVEQLANGGLVALMVSNTPKAMPPWGGCAPLFGTNPIAFAAPRRDKPPLVIDLSLSKVARGKVMRAAQSGERIPTDWALNRYGEPTDDPQEALEGSMLPAGDAKGAALALIVEVLAATLTGANYSFEASSFFDAQGTRPGIGHCIIAIDPKFNGDNRFIDRLEHLIEAIEAQPGVRLPGTTRLQKRQANEHQTFEVSQEVLDKIETKIAPN